ncbi:MAG TPA: hypothetical protein VHR88_05345, partial [Solirubrobacteraceae bacterium]|nr:hypothetical protein [Solirubrobacteraceae bacterium]
MPQETFKVKITSVQKSGSKLVSSRTYTGCEKGKPTTRAHHRRRGTGQVVTEPARGAASAAASRAGPALL